MRKTVNMARVSEAALYLFMAFGVEKRRGWVFLKPRTGPDSTAALLKALRYGLFRLLEMGPCTFKVVVTASAAPSNPALLGLGMVQHMLGQTASSLLGTN